MLDGVRLACDVGAVRIGIAVCDPEGLLASPRPAIPADEHAVSRVAAEALAVNAVEIVVGMPMSLDGTSGPAAQRVQAWIQELTSATPCPVVTIDERLSTVQAQRRLHEGGKTARTSRSIIDSAAAAILLESYLDRLRGGHQS